MLFSASPKLGSSALSHKREPVDSCEADWMPYLDEKCIKVFDKMDIFDKAEEYCGVQNANGEAGRIVTVASSEEQDFLVNYLYKEKKISDSVWLGAILSDNETEHFTWHRAGGQTDQLTYSNWRSSYPKLSGSKADSDDNGNCVQMIGGINEGRGEWINEPCNKNNRIVCEKRQVWTASKMQELLEKLARLQAVLEKTVQENRAEAQAKLDEVAKKAEDALAEAVKKSEDNLNEAQKKTEESLNEVQKNVGENKASIEDVKQKGEETANKLDSTSSSLETVKNSAPVPIGFIYVQLPNEKAPEEIWPSDWYSWTEVSDAYAGVFFRVVGGDAADFGNTQNDNAPRVDEVKRNWCHLDDDHVNCKDEITNPNGDWSASPSEYITLRNNDWSDPVWTVRTYTQASDADLADYHYYHVSSGEVRPLNMAVKVWKRTG